MYYISIIVLSQFYIEHTKHMTQWNGTFLSTVCYLLKTDYIQNSVLFSLQIQINLLLFLGQVYFHILRFTRQLLLAFHCVFPSLIYSTKRR